ncbi:hypothetical protein ACQKLP_00020 [Chitinophaga sp. NPDC101104]|uniref:hypothetical protein n=1 Tax=Chitinophaga sp. NPDC101104 TaxID=3390561 RepID=UPI003D013C55
MFPSVHDTKLQRRYAWDLRSEKIPGKKLKKEGKSGSVRRNGGPKALPAPASPCTYPKMR